MQEQGDTIAAISTAPGEGAIGIVRISGPEAFVVADTVFKRSIAASAKQVVDRKLYYGNIAGVGGEKIDDGFVVFMRGPGSYTGEDCVELFCHGGVLVTAKVLEAVIDAGCRLAGPGEFTERAWVNGKLDLTRAEAVIDVIKASTEGALRSARLRLDGTLSKEIDSIKEQLIDLRVRVEAVLDFPEDEPGDAADADSILTKVEAQIDVAACALKRLLTTYDEGRALKDGVRVLILGRPNVGKSSLLNLLLKFDRAIVTHLPGTTRDVIEEPLNIRSIPVRLIDTAGLRETADLVESIGIEAARAQIELADLLLFVVDLSAPGSFAQDRKIVDGIKGKKVLVVGNKSDAAPANSFTELQNTFPGFASVAVCALQPSFDPSGTDHLGAGGIGSATVALEEAIFTLATGRAAPGLLSGMHGSAVITSLRHKRSLEAALVALERAGVAFGLSAPLELLATDLGTAADSLGEITGAVTNDEILSKIFSRFCIGK